MAPINNITTKKGSTLPFEFDASNTNGLAADGDIQSETASDAEGKMTANERIVQELVAAGVPTGSLCASSTPPRHILDTYRAKKFGSGATYKTNLYCGHDYYKKDIGPWTDENAHEGYGYRHMEARGHIAEFNNLLTLPPSKRWSFLDKAIRGILSLKAPTKRVGYQTLQYVGQLMTREPLPDGYGANCPVLTWQVASDQRHHTVVTAYAPKHRLDSDNPLPGWAATKGFTCSTFYGFNGVAL